MLDAQIAQFAYRRRQPQLTEVNLSIGEGRTVLLGPNGAGKTTLLKAIAGVHGFRGSLTLDGQSVKSGRSRPRRYRAEVGWLPQEVRPFPSLTAHEHVAYVGWLKGMSPTQAAASATEALADVGLQTKAGEKADRLSGGQVRRLGIASVLVHNAKYLLLDEPTAGLDPRERDRLIGILRHIEKSRSVLVSTHDAAGLIDPDSTVAVLHNGSLKYCGSSASFVSGHAAATMEERVRLAYAALVPED